MPELRSAQMSNHTEFRSQKVNKAHLASSNFFKRKNSRVSHLDVSRSNTKLEETAQKILKRCATQAVTPSPAESERLLPVPAITISTPKIDAEVDKSTNSKENSTNSDKAKVLKTKKWHEKASTKLKKMAEKVACGLLWFLDKCTSIICCEFCDDFDDDFDDEDFFVPNYQHPVPSRQASPRGDIMRTSTEIRAAGSSNGIQNIGNFCYGNSVIQTLLNQPFIVSAIQSKHQQSQKTKVPCSPILQLLYDWSTVFKTATPQENSQYAKRLRSLVARSSPEIAARASNQHDAAEFCEVIMQELGFSINIRTWYEGKDTKGRLHRSKFKVDAYAMHKVFFSEGIKPNTHISLQFILDRSTKTQINQDRRNAWQVSPIMSIMNYSTHNAIHGTPPDVLGIHTARFASQPNGRCHKIDNPIDIPDDGIVYIKQGKNKIAYNVFGIVLHHGHSVNSGHYTSYAKCEDGNWYRFDDDKVTMVRKDKVPFEQAYLVFLEKDFKN